MKVEEFTLKYLAVSDRQTRHSTWLVASAQSTDLTHHTVDSSHRMLCTTEFAEIIIIVIFDSILDVDRRHFRLTYFRQREKQTIC